MTAQNDGQEPDPFALTPPAWDRLKKIGVKITLKNILKEFMTGNQYPQRYLKGVKIMSMSNLREMQQGTYRNVLAKMSDGSLIQGKVNVPDSSRRLSDWFRNSTDPFIVVVSEESLENPEEIFICNKSHIVWVKAQD